MHLRELDFFRGSMYSGGVSRRSGFDSARMRFASERHRVGSKKSFRLMHPYAFPKTTRVQQKATRDELRPRMEEREENPWDRRLIEDMTRQAAPFIFRLLLRMLMHDLVRAL